MQNKTEIDLEATKQKNAEIKETIYVNRDDCTPINNSIFYKVEVKRYGGSTAGWETIFEIESIKGHYLKQLWYNNKIFGLSATKIALTEI